MCQLPAILASTFSVCELSTMAGLSVLDKALASIQATPTTLALLRDLHTQALTERPYRSTDAQPASAALDRFVALDPDKCALVYLLLRSTGARYVVEAGTSFGLSTMYLALAVGQNAALQNAEGKVIATENEPAKADRARQHWKMAPELERWTELREGDLRETLKTNLPERIDFLLLDSKPPWQSRCLEVKLKSNLSMVSPCLTYVDVGAVSSQDWLNDRRGQQYRQCRRVQRPRNVPR